MKHEDIVRRIRKLLGLTRSSNANEAAIAAERAQALLAEYNLTLAEISETDSARVQVIEHRTRKRLENWAYALAGQTARAFDCSYFHNEHTGKTSFVGVDADAEVCAWMYGYLYKTLMRLATRYMHVRGQRLRTPSSIREARSSFLLGAVEVLASRMMQQRNTMPVTPCALVPVKEQLISSALPENLTVTRLSHGKVRTNDVLRGMEAGRNISLATPIRGGQPGILTGGY